MPVVLPLLAFGFLIAGFYRRNNGWRKSLLFASIPFSLFLALITEILTQLRWLTLDGRCVQLAGIRNRLPGVDATGKAQRGNRTSP